MWRTVAVGLCWLELWPLTPLGGSHRRRRLCERGSLSQVSDPCLEEDTCYKVNMWAAGNGFMLAHPHGLPHGCPMGLSQMPAPAWSWPQKVPSLDFVSEGGPIQKFQAIQVSSSEFLKARGLYQQWFSSPQPLGLVPPWPKGKPSLV